MRRTTGFLGWPFEELLMLLVIGIRNAVIADLEVECNLLLPESLGNEAGPRNPSAHSLNPVVPFRAVSALQ